VYTGELKATLETVNLISSLRREHIMVDEYYGQSKPNI
jgi:hypothetical protein